MGIKTLTAACVAALAMACAGSAGAGVLYSSLPDLTTAAPVGDWAATFPVNVAGRFTLSAPETITDVRFVTDLSTDLSRFGLVFLSDNNGLPGDIQFGDNVAPSLISSTTLTDTTRLVDLSIPEIQAPALQAGSYWFAIGGTHTWLYGFSGTGDMVQCSNGYTDCTPTGQTLGFDLSGHTPIPPPPGVPEPSTWVVMLLGLLLMGSALRARHWQAAPQVG